MNEILQGDSLSVLKTLQDNFVDCCVTSPPYWGLRDYGVNGQLGLEKTPEEYVAKLVEVFREVKRVLKKEGVMFLNLGDSYAGSGKGRNADGTANIKAGMISKQSKGQMSGIIKKSRFDKWNSGTKDFIQVSHNTPKADYNGLKPKDLVGIPWRVAFALQADGWYLRQDIIWHKPNPMPESVTDRCTKSHEYIFLLTKSPKYYFDNEAIKEKAVYGLNSKDHRPPGIIRDRLYGYDSKEAELRGRIVNETANGITIRHPQGKHGDKQQSPKTLVDYRNKRSVWTITTKPYKEAHFATFPEDLIVPMIKAGCPKDGIVLDPFIGSGTTAKVARYLGRNYLGIELNPAYIELCKKRLSQQIL